MKTINIIINLAKQSDRNQEFMNIGRERGYSKKRIKVADLIEKSLFKKIKNKKYKSLNIKNKILSILKFLEEKDNLLYAHVINKRTIGKNFKKFIDKENEEKYMKNISIVFRLAKNNIFIDNSLIFEVDIYKYDDKIAFELNNILTMNLPEKEHKIVDGMVSIGTSFKFDNKEHNANNMYWLMHLKKPIDLFNDDSNLQIEKWKQITKRIDEFNRHKKKLSMKVFGYNTNIRIDGTNKVQLLVVIPIKGNLSLDKHYFINNDNEGNLKCNINITKIESNYIDTQKDEIQAKIKLLISERLANHKEIDVNKSLLNKDINKLDKKQIKLKIKTLNNKHNIFNKRISKLKISSEFMVRFSNNFNFSLISGIARMDNKKRDIIMINKFDNDLFNISPENFLNSSEWSMSDYDKGTAAIFKRHSIAMQNLSNGIYKSPYLAINLDNPNIPLEISDLSKYPNLNEKQQMAFQMINNSYQSSFLQGPPGTGKTQVISAIISSKVQKNEITLISSSTNEAINNAFDRVNNDQYDNPNIIFSRISNGELQREKAKEYLENMIPYNFIKKMINFAMPDDIREDFSYEDSKYIIKNYKKKKINSCIPAVWFDNFYTEIYILQNISFFKKLLNLNSNYKEDKDFFKNNKSIIDEFKREKELERDALNPKMIEKIERVYKINIELLKNNKNSKLSTYNFISILRIKKTKKPNIFNKLLKVLSNDIENNNIISGPLYKQIIIDVEKNNLVNVLGITTTSRQEITLNGIKKAIFIDYPVDFAIIDEVSKSTTPEIIQISSLASKFLYAGDYRQLPPSMDLQELFFEELWGWNNEDNKNRRFNSLIENNNINNHEELGIFIENLYQNTLFKNHVSKLKSNNYINSYTSLNLQYRFTKDIASLVNILYDDNERLLTNFEDKDFNSYQTNLLDNKSKSSIQILDTSKISKSFIDFCKVNNAKYIPLEFDDSFDHKKSILFEKRIYPSRINEYNAYEGIKLIIRLKELNKENFNTNKIGYICMTRSQADIIQRIILNKFTDELWLRKIKIDTVDNFQGRERDIIIVDLVRAKGNLGFNYEIKDIERNLDFYSSSERINVAVSRAKSKLILLGAIENHLSKKVTTQVTKNGKTVSLKIFERFLEVINEKGYVNKIWNK